MREVALLFLKLGTIGFGGPAAHVALMREEVVRRRGWVDDQRFLDLVGATNLIPDPTPPSSRSTWATTARGGAGCCWRAPASSCPRR